MQPWLLRAPVLLVLASQRSPWRAPLWQNRHSQLSEMQVSFSFLPQPFALSCITSLLLGLFPLCCSHSCLHFCFDLKANFAAVLCDAAHLQPLSCACAQARVWLKWLHHRINNICCCVMQVQHCVWLFCNCLSCLCRKSSTIVIADIVSTLLVMLWLMYIIHVTLIENEEDAQNTPKPVRISEFLKVNALVNALYHHHQFLAAVWFTSKCRAVSPYISLVTTMQPHAS